MHDFRHESFDDDVELLSAVINDIEEDKARVRRECDHMKDVYHRGSWRSEGYENQRALVERMERRFGEVLGFENALRTLYSALQDRKARHNDD